MLYIADREHDASLQAVFAAGASDYVVRNWDPDDLFARALRLLCVASTASGSGVVRVGPLRLDRDKAEASVGNRRLELYPAEYGVLAYLLTILRVP